MWQDRLPREAGEAAPPISIRPHLGRWLGRSAMVALPLLVIAAVVLRSFDLVTISAAVVGLAGLLLLGMVGAVLLPFRSRLGHRPEGD